MAVMSLQMFNGFISDFVEDISQISEEYLLRGDQVNAEQNTVALSSLEIVEVIINIETQFKITITEDEVLALKTVGDVIRFVNEETEIQKTRNLNKEDIKGQLFGEKNEVVEI